MYDKEHYNRLLAARQIDPDDIQQLAGKKVELTITGETFRGTLRGFGDSIIGSPTGPQRAWAVDGETKSFEFHPHDSNVALRLI